MGENRVFEKAAEIQAQTALSTFLSVDLGEIISLAFSPDEQTLATGALDRTVKLWDLATGKELRMIRGHGSGVNSVGWSSDGRLLVTGGGEGSVKVWDAFAKAMPVMPDQVVKSFRGTSFSSTGELLALGTTPDSHVRVWNESTVRVIAFSADSRLMATAADDNTIRLWDIAAGKGLTQKVQSDAIMRIAFSPDGKRMVSGGLDGSVILWNVGDMHEVISLRGLKSEVTSVAFSGTGTALAVSSLEGAVKVWQVANIRESDERSR
jgi:WD40 repeat protein